MYNSRMDFMQPIAPPARLKVNISRRYKRSMPLKKLSIEEKNESWSIDSDHCWFVSGDGLSRVKVPFDAACSSTVICNMLKSPFKEALEGCIIFYSMDAMCIREVALFLTSRVKQSSYSCHSLSIKQLFQLLEASHFLQIRGLFSRVSVAISDYMYQIEQLYDIPNVLIEDMSQYLTATSRYKIEILICKEERKNVNIENSWKNEYNRRINNQNNNNQNNQNNQHVSINNQNNQNNNNQNNQNNQHVSINVCKQLCIEYFLQKMAKLYINTKQSTSSSSSYKNKHRGYKQHKQKASKKINDELYIRLQHDFQLCGFFVKKFKLENGVVEGRLLEIILSCLTNAIILDISNVGYSTKAGLSISRACKLLLPIYRIDLSYVCMSIEGLRTLSAALISAETQCRVNESYLPAIRTSRKSKNYRKTKINQQSHSFHNNVLRYGYNDVKASDLGNKRHNHNNHNHNNNNHNMLSLSLLNNPIGDVAVTSICNSISLVAMHTLLLSGNDLGCKGGTILADLVRKLRNLQILDISSCNLGKVGVSVVCLAAGVSTCGLTYLNISDNIKKQFTQERSQYPDPGKCIANMILNNVNLNHLNLSKNMFTEEDCLFISRSLSEKQSLCVLDLSYVHISSITMHMLNISITNNNCKLKKLSLSGTALDKECIMQLSDILCRNKTLITLNMDSLSFFPDGISSISDVFHHNSTLKNINLCGCSNEEAIRMRAEGCAILMRGLESIHHSIREINISYHGLRNAGFICVLSTVLLCTTLEKVILQHNRIDVKGILAFVGIMSDLERKSKYHTFFDLRNNNLSMNECQIYMQTLNNCRIVKYMLKRNQSESKLFHSDDDDDNWTYNDDNVRITLVVES